MGYSLFYRSKMNQRSSIKLYAMFGVIFWIFSPTMIIYWGSDYGAIIFIKVHMVQRSIFTSFLDLLTLMEMI